MKDVGDIIKHKRLRSPFILYKKLRGLGFSLLDFAYILDGFRLAYGMDWLRDFFEKNQEELRQYY